MPRRPLSRFVYALTSVLAFWAVAPAVAEPEAAKGSDPKFVRVQNDAAGSPLALQVATVHFGRKGPNEKPLTVDLIGAIHVGEKAYYDALNLAFRQYEVVLYELVAPPGTRVVKGASRKRPLGMLQNAMGDLLKLEHQLDVIDYAAANFVHADMTPDGFAKSMEQRGESFWTMCLRMIGHSLAQEQKAANQGRSIDAELLVALLSKDRSVHLKRLIARQFGEMDASLDALSGPEGSTIITERNKVALQGLGEQIASGKKRIAIFYGAGHLPDMEKRLVSQFGMHRSGESWLTAWNLSDPSAAKRKPLVPSTTKP